MNTATIHSIDHEGRGVARIHGKTTFITGALPQETVAYQITRSKKHHDEAQATRILTPSPYRTAHACPHYSQCGGCTLQHVHSTVQVAYKQRILEDQLQRLGKVRPQYLLPPSTAKPGATATAPASAPTTAKADLVKLIDQGLVREIPLNGVKRGYVRGEKFDSWYDEQRN